MKYRVSYILTTGIVKGKNFDTKKQMEDFVLNIMEMAKKIRVLNKTTREIWTV